MHHMQLPIKIPAENNKQYYDIIGSICRSDESLNLKIEVLYVRESSHERQQTAHKYSIIHQFE